MNSYMRLVTAKEVFKLRMSSLLTPPKVELKFPLVNFPELVYCTMNHSRKVVLIVENCQNQTSKCPGRSNIGQPTENKQIETAEKIEDKDLEELVDMFKVYLVEGGGRGRMGRGEVREVHLAAGSMIWGSAPVLASATSCISNPFLET